MVDPIMSTVLLTGGLSLRELFGRVGAHLANRLLLAHLVKNGEVRFELTPPQDGRPKGSVVDELLRNKDSSDEKLADLLAVILKNESSDADSAEEIEIIPTVKAWRSNAG